MNRLPPRTNSRGGLTLIELVVAVAIIGILAAILLGVAAAAGVTAREARTKSMVSRLHTLLIERYDQYRIRRIELNTRDTNNNDVPDWRDAATPANTGIDFSLLDNRLQEAAGRVAALRELMKLELPDRWSDVLGQPVPAVPLRQLPLRPAPAEPGFLASEPLLFLRETPSLWSTYAREYNRLVGATNSLTGNVNTGAEIVENEAAELLYLIVIHATGDGEARSLFKEDDFGDTDGDGAFEFLDGWGQPIAFVRWPAGFESDLQLDAPGLATLPDVEIAAQVIEDHDPYDLFRVDNPSTGAPRGWRQTPLIVSAGRDGEFGVTLTNNAGNLLVRADPYANFDNPTAWLGSTSDQETIADNIHNHTLGGLTRTQ